MPAAKQSGRTTRAASRGRSSSNGSRSRSPSRSPSRSQARNGRSNAGRSQSRANAGRAQSSNDSNNRTLLNVGVSAVSATIGVAGGMLLGRTAFQRNRKLLGIDVPRKVDLTGIGQQIGEAGRQFGKLAGEVRAVREKAEQIGKAIS